MTEPRWKRRSGERPKEICGAALEVFSEKGFAAARLDEIARRAGVSKGTLYLYFRDKEDLFRAVIRDTIAPNVEAVRGLFAAAQPPFAELVPIFLSRFAMIAQTAPIGAVAKMVIGESRNFPELAKAWHDEVVSKAIGLVTELVRNAQERGEVREGDPRLFAFSLMGPMVLGVLWRETLQPAGGAPVNIDALAAQHCMTVLTGILK